MKSILEKLKGGDLRSIGKSNEVVRLVLKNPRHFKELFNGIAHPDPLIRMRAADVAEKIGSKYPKYLQPFKRKLMNEIAEIPQQEVRWHAAQMLSYVSLTPKERGRVSKLLFSWLKTEKSNIVRVMSLQTLSNLAKHDKSIKTKIMPLFRKFLKGRTPSLKSRSRKLLKEFTATDQSFGDSCN